MKFNKKQCAWCILVFATLETKQFCQAIILVNDTKTTKQIELSTEVDDHIWMRQHNTYQNAPRKKIPLFRATMVPRDILKTPPFFLNAVMVTVFWGKNNKNRHEQRFTLAESLALEGDRVPHLFTDHHIIRLIDLPEQMSKKPAHTKAQKTAQKKHPIVAEPQKQITAELLYLPHGIGHLRNRLGERRAAEKMAHFKVQ
jgi:hypothetical protein